MTLEQQKALAMARARRRRAEALAQTIKAEPEPIAKPKTEEMGIGHQIGTGAAEGFMRLGSGLRSVLPKSAADTLGLATPESVADISAYNEGSGWATGGRAATDIATSMLPVGAATGVATKVAPRVAPLIGDIIGSGLYSAATADEGKRLEGAAFGVAGSGLGNLAGRAMGRVVNPSGPISQEAQILMDKGIPLTPGQAGDGIAEAAEGFMAKIPGVGGMVRNRQQEAQEATAQALGRELGIKNISPFDTAQEVVQSVRAGQNDAYADAFQAAAPDVAQKFNPKFRQIKAEIRQLRGIEPGHAKAVLADTALGISQIKAAQSPAEAADIWKDVDHLIGAKGERFKPIQEQWRKEFFNAAGPDAAEKVLQGDLSERFALGLEKAVGNRTDATPEQFMRALRGKNIDPQHVQAEAQKYVSPAAANRLAAQANKVNQLAESSARVVKKNVSPWTAGQGASALGLGAFGLGAMPAALLAGGLSGATASLYSKPGIKYATGQAFKKQQALAELLRAGKLNEVLRRVGATQTAAANERKY